MSRRATPTCRRPSSASLIDWREGTELRRGDLVFWEGHVGIMTSGTHLLHANAFHMAVEIEPFAEASARIREAGYEVIGVRRLPRIAAAALKRG